MFLSKPRYTLLLSLIGTIIVLFACSDKEIRLLKEIEVVTTEKLCYLKEADHGHGVIYNLSYNSTNQLIKDGAVLVESGQDILEHLLGSQEKEKAIRQTPEPEKKFI